MLWVYAQLCSYHLATGRNERRRREKGEGGRREEGIAADRLVFREKDKLARAQTYVYDVISVFRSLRVNEIKEPASTFRPMQKKGGVKGEEEVSRRTRSSTNVRVINQNLSVCLPRNVHLSDERRLFGRKFRVPHLNHPS